MLNASPLNAVPLNGLAGAAAEPEYIVRGQSFVWALRLLVDGMDHTAQLTGQMTIIRQEGAAGLADFGLFIALGLPVVPPDWKGRTVTIDYISTSQYVTTEARRYTGQISIANWNPVSRVLTCECSDQVQQRVEGMSVPAINALVGGHWSADVFEPVEGRSHWDYALERLSTRPVSLDCSPTGDLRVTSWYATAPQFVFGPGTTLYQTVDLQQSDLDESTNRVEIEFGYRYNRLWQLNERYVWRHPGTLGLDGMAGFCQWRTDPTELPQIGMVEDAASGSGQTVLNPDYYRLPLTMADPCGTGVGWTNVYDDLLLGVTWTSARRWVQTVTETYSLTLATAAGEAEATRIVQRSSATVNVESDMAEAWTEGPIDGSGGAFDIPNDARRNAAMVVALRMGQVEIIGAHRETTVSWQVPTSMALGVDLVHTLQVADQGVNASGKCRRIVDSFDLGSGSAVTTISIAIMRGGGVSDPLTLPGRLGEGQIGEGEGNVFYTPLPTQLGGRTGIPPYDDELDGFAGNYSQNNPNAEVFPRRLSVTAAEIPAAQRDEQLLDAAVLYRVGIPNDLLEL
ncbi:hypothetical protein N7325_13585 [Stutzerimonas stutzeri]|uniref:hypothetical protein n=1 Tax=Stutzerimonas stutzeri TaxID=316 RepID=UPI0024489C1E|nr:hypothetical protein [Stutzerimonas stutzeri]MDH0120845.1 hypothetical protein [Stutzerimonas stutzeri]